MRRSLITLALVLVVLIGGGVGYAIYQINRIHRVVVHDLTPRATVGKQAGTENILLVGSTSRCAVKPAKNFENFVQECKAGVNGVNSDVIMVLRLQPGRAPMLLSIPRDTFVPNARAGGLYNKIDAALADGPDQLVAAIQQDFGIPINHYVVLNFQTFANIVTALGGISMYFPTTLYDAYSGLRINNTGCVHISGLMALALVRARHLNYNYDKATGQWRGYDPTGDLGRIVRVHLFLRALAAEVAKRGLSNPVTDNALLSALAPDLTVDSTFGIREMLSLLLEYHSSLSKAQEMTLPIVEDTQLYYYQGYDYGDVVFPVQPEDSQTIAAFLGEHPKLPAASSIRVSVVNATTSPSAASATVQGLNADGFKVTATTSTTPVGPIAETSVVYPDAAALPAAERVLASLSGTAVLARGKPTPGSEVSVVVGTNVAVSHVVTTAAHRGRAPLAATLLGAAVPANVPNSGSIISPPTPATSSVPWFDPRPCPAAAK